MSRTLGEDPLLGARRLGAAVAALVLSACQTVLVPNSRVAEQGEPVRGWVAEPDALILLEAYDHCEQAWREVSRASVDPKEVRLGAHAGHAWRAQLLPASFQAPGCVLRPDVQEGADGLTLRVKARRGDVQRVLPSLGATALQCLMDGPWQEQSAAELLAGCETFDALPLLLDPACPPGQAPQMQVVPLSKAGNLRRLLDPTSEASALMYHFEDSLLVGNEPPVFGMEREYRNYLLFDPPERTLKVQAAWISWFSNHETLRCAHREDIGCGYASVNSYEDFVLSWVDLRRSPDPRSLAFGLAIQNPAPLAALFLAAEQSPVVGRLRMQAQDVDRWFQIPLNQAALDKLNAQAPGQSIMFAGRVRPQGAQGAQERSLLFVDHLIGTSIPPEQEPRLTLLYCEEASMTSLGLGPR